MTQWQTDQEQQPTEPPPREPRPTSRILVAEDDDEFRHLLLSALSNDGLDVTSCRTGADLLYRLRLYLLDLGDEEYDLIISDIRMPGASGLEVLESLRDCQPRPPMILITGFGDAATHAQARALGAVSVLDKPFQIDALLSEVHRVLGPQRDERSPPGERSRDGREGAERKPDRPA
jgi:CheY-like chemotaxis protein